MNGRYGINMRQPAPSTLPSKRTLKLNKKAVAALKSLEEYGFAKAGQRSLDPQMEGVVVDDEDAMDRQMGVFDPRNRRQRLHS